MGRLIDADFLISYIEEELALKYTGHLSDDVVCGMISRQNEIIQFIKAQPTAFNVEAVMKALEKLEEKYMNNSEKAAELGIDYERHMIYYGAKGNAFAEAIDVVKGGVKCF